VPDRSGARWPSGAQKLVCQGGCVSAPLSEQQLAEIAARAEAATAGPWGSRRDLDGVYTVQARPRITPTEGNTSDGDVAWLAPAGDEQTYANAWFIARARTDVPALLADNARLRARVAELETALATAKAEPERAMLAFALDLAGVVIASRGSEFTDEDRAALESLRQLATEAGESRG
jgi:hypothetical protein